MNWKTKKKYKKAAVDLGSMGELGAKQSGKNPAAVFVPDNMSKHTAKKHSGFQKMGIKAPYLSKKLVGEA